MAFARSRRFANVQHQVGVVTIGNTPEWLVPCTSDPSALDRRLTGLQPQASACVGLGNAVDRGAHTRMGRP